MPNRKRPHFLGVWLSDAAQAAVNAEAQTPGSDRSDAVRRMLAYATWKMPVGWKP